MSELLVLKSRNFHYNIRSDGDEWNSLYLTRFFLVTSDSLPSIAGSVKVTKHFTKKSTNKEYFMAKLNAFNEKLLKEIENVRSLAPPKKLADQY